MNLKIPVINVRVYFMKLCRDRHTGPHLMNREGGCACSCRECVTGITFVRCVCRRCSQDCPAIARLGSVENFEDEREWARQVGITYRPAKRWYLQ
jgi:hypothetical protein